MDVTTAVMEPTTAPANDTAVALDRCALLTLLGKIPKSHTERLFEYAEMGLAAAGIILNGYVFLVLLMEKINIPKQALYFVTHQVFIDMLISALFLLALNHDKAVYTGDYGWDIVQCYVLERYVLLWATFTVSVYNVTAMSLQRAVVIVTPLTQFTPTHTRLMIVLQYLLAVLLYIPTIVLDMEIDFSCPQDYCRVKFGGSLAPALVYSLSSQLLPLCVNIPCYVAIFVKLRAPGHLQRHGQSADTLNIAQKKLLYNAIAHTVSYVLLIAPGSVVFTLFMFGYLSNVFSAGSPLQLALTACKVLNSTLTPVLFISFLSHVRQAVIAPLSCGIHDDNITDSVARNSSDKATDSTDKEQSQAGLSNDFITS